MNFPGEASHTYFFRRKVSASRILQVPDALFPEFFQKLFAVFRASNTINADSIAFVNAGKKEELTSDPKKGAKAKKNTPTPPADAPEAKAEDLPF